MSTRIPSEYFTESHLRNSSKSIKKAHPSNKNIPSLSTAHGYIGGSMLYPQNFKSSYCEKNPFFTEQGTNQEWMQRIHACDDEIHLLVNTVFV